MCKKRERRAAMHPRAGSSCATPHTRGPTLLSGRVPSLPDKSEGVYVTRCKMSRDGLVLDGQRETAKPNTLQTRSQLTMAARVP